MGDRAKGREVKKLCEKKNWKMKGFADNDKTYWGGVLKIIKFFLRWI